MFSIEAESIINKTWSNINRSSVEKTLVMPKLEERGISMELIKEAVSCYPMIKNRKPDVLARRCC